MVARVGVLLSSSTVWLGRPCCRRRPILSISTIFCNLYLRYLLVELRLGRARGGLRVGSEYVGERLWDVSVGEEGLCMMLFLPRESQEHFASWQFEASCRVVYQGS